EVIKEGHQRADVEFAAEHVDGVTSLNVNAGRFEVAREVLKRLHDAAKLTGAQTRRSQAFWRGQIERIDAALDHSVHRRIADRIGDFDVVVVDRRTQMARANIVADDGADRDRFRFFDAQVRVAVKERLNLRVRLPEG